MSRTRTTTVMLASCLWVLPATLGLGCGSEGGDDGDEPHSHADGGDDHHHGHDEPVGDPSGAECPAGSTLTYDNFAKKFFADYCLSCHSSKVTGNARMGAPNDHNFDTLGEIDLLADHIDQKAAFGPDSENDDMPPSGPKPSDEDREKLGEWLECGLKE
jgi:hypothetical protein